MESQSIRQKQCGIHPRCPSVSLCQLSLCLSVCLSLCLSVCLSQLSLCLSCCCWGTLFDNARRHVSFHMARMAGVRRRTLHVIIRPRRSYPETLRAWFGSEQVLRCVCLSVCVSVCLSDCLSSVCLSLYIPFIVAPPLSLSLSRE